MEDKEKKVEKGRNKLIKKTEKKESGQEKPTWTKKDGRKEQINE